MEVDYFNIYACICASISIICSCGLLVPLNRMKSNYAKIMRNIVVAECIFIFCELMVIIDSETDSYTKILCNILNIILFNTLDSDDCSLTKRTSYAGYFGMQAFTLWLNIFVCYEIILILKNPVAQLKNRFRRYYLTSLFIGLLVFGCTFTYTPEFYTNIAIISQAKIPM
jgi:hypothetical protein